MTEPEREIVERARQTADVLYRGEQVEHRSCGVAVAQTFGLNPAAYSVLRRGGLTGDGSCGAIRAGEMALAELLAPEQYIGDVPDALRQAIEEYRRLYPGRLDRDPSDGIVCNDLLSPFDDFESPERKGFCTNLAAGFAALVAELALKYGAAVRIAPIPEE